jgi:hypothetical protein
MSMELEEWKSRYRRAMGMSSKELANRLRQQATARLDFLRYKVGIEFEPRLDGSTSARPAPHFFFSTDDIPRLCSRLRELFPEQTERIIAQAERICKHRFDLLGYRELDYGMEIDWHCDRVHAKRASRKPWFQIRYLDFEEVGDSKVTWELNRHQHLVTLAKAFQITGDASFANELFRQWKHWHRENPYPIGINWASSLEVAFRSISWLWVYFLMSGSAVTPAEFHGEVVRSLSVSGRHIASYLSTYFSPNTHLLGEGAALFFIGTLCPELPRAKRWQGLGWKVLLEAAERQVREDGLHFEQSIYYHVYALDCFLHSSVLASRNEITIPANFERTVEHMLEALSVLARFGPLPRLGDDDGGRLFDPQRNRAEHLLDPLATGAVLFSRADFKNAASGPHEEMLWLLGEAGLAEFDRLRPVPPVCVSTAFEKAGLYVMTSCDPENQLVIDAGPQGADTAGHGHADALSITASAAGHALLIDPGTFEYVGKDETERNHFRGTRAHNTLLVDGQDQAEPKGPFSWKSLPNVRAEQWINGETFDFFAGSHDGYMRLADPVVHRRFVFSLKSGPWLVRDEILGREQHQLDLFWHIDPKLLPEEQTEATFRGTGAGLSISGLENQGWSQEILSGEYSPAYGVKEPHCVLHFKTMAVLPAEFVTLLIPHPIGVKANGVALRRVPSVGESAIGYRFSTTEEEHYVCFGQGKSWTMSPWSSDAEFLYWSHSRENLRRTFICCNASYVEAGGRKIISSARTFLRCEVVSLGGRLYVVSSDQKTVIDQELFQTIFSAKQ